MSSPVPVPFSLGKRLEDLTTLSKSRLLCALDVREVAYLFESFDVLTVDAGIDVANVTGEPHVGFLLSGRAQLLHGDVEVGSLNPGDHYGERVLLRQRATPVHVIAETPLRVARLTLERFESLAQRKPRLALDLLRAIAARATDNVHVLSERLHALVGERSLERAPDLRVRIGDDERVVPMGTSIAAVFADPSLEIDTSSVLAARLDGRPTMLDTKLSANARLAPILANTARGDDVLHRSAGLAVLDVLAELRPEWRGRVQPDADGTLVIDLATSFTDATQLEQLAHEVAAELSRRLEQPVAFSEELWTVEEARAYFHERGELGAVALLDARPTATVVLSRCGHTYALSFGPCVSTTRELGPLVIEPDLRGLLVRILRTPRTLTTRTLPRYNGPMAEAHRHWLSAFGASSVGELAQLASSGRIADLVLAAEAFHEKELGRIADDVARRVRDGVRVLRVAGPSSSGKTTFLRRLRVALSLVGLRTVGLSLDDYYVDRERTVRDEHGEYDFESPLALDAELLCQQLEVLVRGEPLVVARYDFLSGRSLPAGGPELTLGKDDLLVVEGLHALEPTMLPESLAAASMGIFVHPATIVPMDRLTCLAPTDLRLLRRIVRDRHSRGYRAKDTLVRWPSVRRGEEQHVFSRLAHADHVFDTALAYEPCVIKMLAERCLLEVPRDDSTFAEACRLRELLAGYIGLEPGYVPSSSILREFIGSGPA